MGAGPRGIADARTPGPCQSRGTRGLGGRGQDAGRATATVRPAHGHPRSRVDGGRDHHGARRGARRRWLQAQRADGRADRSRRPGLYPARWRHTAGRAAGWNSGRYAFTRRVLEGERAGELYRQRQVMVEPVFADTKFNRGIDRFLRRGRSAARSEWRLITAAGNLLKLHRHQLRSPAPDMGRRGRPSPTLARWRSRPARSRRRPRRRATSARDSRRQPQNAGAHTQRPTSSALYATSSMGSSSDTHRRSDLGRWRTAPRKGIPLLVTYGRA
jgi:hypothetical protein